MFRARFEPFTSRFEVYRVFHYAMCLVDRRDNGKAWSRNYWLYSPCGPWTLFSFLIYSQSVGLLGRAISSPQSLYLNTGHHKQNKRIYTPNVHALSGIRTHDHSVRASGDSSCPRPLGYRDWQPQQLPHEIWTGFMLIYKEWAERTG
jgi:hypothetical protein